MSALEELERLIDAEAQAGRDVAVELQTETECAWSGELRFTPQPNGADHRPDRSFVLYATGGAGPEEIVGRLLTELDAWRCELGL